MLKQVWALSFPVKEFVIPKKTSYTFVFLVLAHGVVVRCPQIFGFVVYIYLELCHIAVEFDFLLAPDCKANHKLYLFVTNNNSNGLLVYVEL